MGLLILDSARRAPRPRIPRQQPAMASMSEMTTCMSPGTAAIAVALREAQGKQFKNYARQVVKNAKVLATGMSVGSKIGSGKAHKKVHLAS